MSPLCSGCSAVACGSPSLPSVTIASVACSPLFKSCQRASSAIVSMDLFNVQIVTVLIEELHESSALRDCASKIYCSPCGMNGQR